MKSLRIILAVVTLSALGCADTSKVSPVFTGSTSGTVALDLNSAAQQAMTAYAKVKAGGVDYVWGLTQAFSAYATIAKTTADVRALVAAWDGTKDQTLANRLASLFGATSGSTEERMMVLAAAAMETAQALDSSP